MTGSRRVAKGKTIRFMCHPSYSQVLLSKDAGTSDTASIVAAGHWHQRARWREREVDLHVRDRLGDRRACMASEPSLIKRRFSRILIARGWEVWT